MHSAAKLGRLVLLHGWGMNAGAFRMLAPEFESRFDVVVENLPGHGGQAFATGDLSPDAVARALAEKYTEPAFYVGWSLGGAVVQQLALQAPDRVAGACYVTSTPCFVNRVDWQCGMTPENVAQFSENLSRNFKLTLDTFLALQAMGSPDSKSVIRQLRKDVRDHGEPLLEALSEGLDVLMNHDARESLAALSVPGLWLFGSHDRIVMPCAARSLADNSSQRGIVYDDCSHLPFVTHRAQFVEDVTNFFSGVRNAS